MDRYTFETLKWLDLRFDPAAHAALGLAYRPYQPIFGVQEEAWGPDEFQMAARVVRLLSLLWPWKGGSFLDVGGAEGFTAYVMREALGQSVVSLDLSAQAGQRAVEYYGLPALAADSALLPFRDGSFDVVCLSEVLEHVEHPVRTLLELMRVARHLVIVTTQEISRDETEQHQDLKARHWKPHMDRSLLCPADLRTVFNGWHLKLMNQCGRIPAPLPLGRDGIAAALHEVLASRELGWPSHGVVLGASRAGGPPVSGPSLSSLISKAMAFFDPGSPPGRPAGSEAPCMGILNRLCCPVTKAPLHLQEEWLKTPDGQKSYSARNGVPRLYSAPGECFPTSFEAVLADHYGGGSALIPRLLELREKLRYELPRPLLGGELTAGSPTDWEVVNGRILPPLAGIPFRIQGEDSDLQLHSPRLQIPLEKWKGLRLEMALEASPRNDEVQVFWWTLNRPLWWEGASIKAPIQVDGQFHVVRLELDPESLQIQGDELLRLRIDPCHDAALVAIRRLTLLQAP